MTGKIIHSGSGASSRGPMSLLKRKESILVQSLVPLFPRSPVPCSLVHRSLREIMALRFQVQSAEGLLVLCEILTQNVPQCLGLLRAQVDGLVVADGDLLRRFARGPAEDKL